MPMCRTPVHALAPRGCQRDLVGRAAAAFRDMGRRAPLALIDDTAGEQRVARGVEAGVAGARDEALDGPDVEMGLGPVEIEPGDFEGQPRKTVGLRGKQLVEPWSPALLLSRRHPASLIVGEHAKATPG